MFAAVLKSVLLESGGVLEFTEFWKPAAPGRYEVVGFFASRPAYRVVCV